MEKIGQLDNLEFQTNKTFFGGVADNTQQYWNDINATGGGMFDKLKTTIGVGQPKQEGTFYEELQQQSSFSYVQKLTIFIIMMGLGIGFIGMSTMFLFAPKTFAKFYTIGSLCIIFGLIVLVGVKKQIENIMSTKERMYSSLIYLASIFGTLYCALGIKSTILTILMVTFQFASVLWYSLSYIPFGQAMLSSIVTKVVGLK